MSRVEILRLKPDGSQEAIAQGQLGDDNVVQLEGDPEFIKLITSQGILDRTTNPTQRLFPKDGERFLQALEPALTSGYLTVRQVPEEK